MMRLIADVWDDIEAAWDGIDNPTRRAWCPNNQVDKHKAHRCDCNAPKNNDGRKDCYWCAGPLIRVTGFNSVYDYCERCKK